MPAECPSCSKTFTNKQLRCTACNHYCHNWDDPSLPKPSALPVIRYAPAKATLFLSGLKNGVHKKRTKSEPTQATLRVKNKSITKTQRQQHTLNRAIESMRKKEPKVISQYGNGGALVQIVMTPSTRAEAPSFWGIKRDGSVHPRVPTDGEIPIQYRHTQDDYDSSDDESLPPKKKQTLGSSDV